MSVRNLQFNRLWLALLGSDALVVALDCLLAGQVTLACISLVDQELDIHLYQRKISYYISFTLIIILLTYAQGALVALTQWALDTITVSLLVLVVICVIL